jgi:hypothetical protein
MSDELGHELAAARAIAEACWFRIATAGSGGLRHDLLTGRSSADNMLRELRRNHLLVRPELTPGVERAVSRACANLRVPRKLVLAFIKPDNDLKGYCLPSADRALLFLSSGLVTNLSEEELAFVIGHEIGHFILPEAHVESDDRTTEGLMHNRACEFTMDRIGLVACGETKPACNAVLKIMSGLTEPHLRLDVSAAMQESRETYDGTLVRFEAQSTHPPLLMRLRALLRFAITDACLDPMGKQGGSPVRQANQELVDMMNANVDGAARRQVDESLRMVKAWFHCILRARGETSDLARLNRVEPTVDLALLDKAWASLQGLGSADIGEHAMRRLKSSIEKAVGHSPDRAKAILEDLTEGNPERYFS